MRAVETFDISDFPVCAECRFVMVEKEYGHPIAWGCTKIFRPDRRDIISGEISETPYPYAALVRSSEKMCGLEGLWFEKKDSP